MSYLIKLNRLSAWLLVALMLIYFFTGFDSLKNIWRPDLSRYLHDKILPLPALIIVFFHMMVGLKLFLVRRQLENKFLNTIFILTGLLIFGLFVYLFWR